VVVKTITTLLLRDTVVSGLDTVIVFIIETVGVPYTRFLMAYCELSVQAAELGVIVLILNFLCVDGKSESVEITVVAVGEKFGFQNGFFHNC